MTHRDPHVPCPSWCEIDHRQFEEGEPRRHALTLNDHTDIAADGDAPPSIHVWIGGDTANGTLDANEARQLAAGLTEAAAWLDGNHV